jgi:hypothetical protein
VDPAGAVLGAGTFWSALDLGVASLSSAGGPDVYVLKLDSAGSPVWGRAFGDALEQYSGSIAAGPGGTAIVTGALQGVVDFGGGSLASAGGMDVFVVKLDAAGEHVWSLRAGDGADQWGTGVAADSAGYVVVTGRFSGTLDLGEPLASASGEDVFVARIAP